MQSLTEQSYEQVDRSLPSKGEKSMSVTKSKKIIIQTALYIYYNQLEQVLPE